ncbi:elongation factor P [Candidatus Peregrinibacteria bacterium]|nr:elongation factor P [Candidatus Peregrinibacteria bacterium]
MSSLTEIRTGSIVKINNAPYLVVWQEFSRKQQRKPVVRSKLKNIINGNVMDKTFLSGEAVEFADVTNRKCQYMYKDHQSAFFMDSETFEQFEIPLDTLERELNYLIDGMDVYIVFYEGRPITVDLPPKMVLKVIETTPGVKGDTATGGTKPATLETKLVVNVPLFIKEGDSVKVNTENGEYDSRA